MAIEHVPVCANTIGELDIGTFGRAIDVQIRRIMEDIQARPCNVVGKTEPRKLKIELAFEPEVEIDPDDRTAHIRKINLNPTVWGVVPKTVGGVTDVRIVRNQPCFNKDCPQDFKQATLDYGSGDD